MGCNGLQTGNVEQLVYTHMLEKLKEFKSVATKSHGKTNPKLTAAKVELAQIDAEIERLIESLTGANATLLSFANRKAEELETKKQTVALEIATLSAMEIPVARIDEISYHLDNWENTSFDDKRQVMDGVISTIRVTNDDFEIEWKI